MADSGDPWTEYFTTETPSPNVAFGVTDPQLGEALVYLLLRDHGYPEDEARALAAEERATWQPGVRVPSLFDIVAAIEART